MVWLDELCGENSGCPCQFIVLRVYFKQSIIVEHPVNMLKNDIHLFLNLKDFRLNYSHSYYYCYHCHYHYQDYHFYHCHHHYHYHYHYYYHYQDWCHFYHCQYYCSCYYNYYSHFHICFSCVRSYR